MPLPENTATIWDGWITGRRYGVSWLMIGKPEGFEPLTDEEMPEFRTVEDIREFQDGVGCYYYAATIGMLREEITRDMFRPESKWPYHARALRDYDQFVAQVYYTTVRWHPHTMLPLTVDLKPQAQLYRTMLAGPGHRGVMLYLLPRVASMKWLQERIGQIAEELAPPLSMTREARAERTRTQRQLQRLAEAVRAELEKSRGASDP